MFNTKVAKVGGMLTLKNKGMIPTNVIVRFTSDHGETLSLADANDNVMLTVAYEDVEKLIEKTRIRRTKR